MPVLSMHFLVKSLKSQFGPAFVLLELVMHIYLSAYLTFHWTNWTIWGFTAFETVGFIYLLATGRNKEEKSHMRRYQFCGCLCDCKRGA